MDSLPPAGQGLFGAKYIPGQRLLPTRQHHIHPCREFLNKFLRRFGSLSRQPQRIGIVPLTADPQRYGALGILLHGDEDKPIVVAVSHRKLAFLRVIVEDARNISGFLCSGGTAQRGVFIVDLRQRSANEIKPSRFHAVPVGVAGQLKIGELIIFIGDSRVRDLGVPADCRTGIGVGVGRGGRRFAAGGQSRRQQAAQGQCQNSGQFFHVVPPVCCRWCKAYTKYNE